MFAGFMYLSISNHTWPSPPLLPLPFTHGPPLHSSLSHSHMALPSTPPSPIHTWPSPPLLPLPFTHGPPLHSSLSHSHMALPSTPPSPIHTWPSPPLLPLPYIQEDVPLCLQMENSGFTSIQHQKQRDYVTSSKNLG